MDIEDFDFYEDDEGISVNIVFDIFNENKIKVIYLESDSSDEKMVSDINFILKNQNEFLKLSEEKIASYVYSVYKNKDVSFKLMKVYISPDIENEFGFLFRWSGDTEHGIGIKFSGLSVKKIGSSEIAFL
ncbi:hypothetical protein F6Q07_10165 [Pectobacterium parmentieri]|uniref:DUF2004 domain-containing protein n=1 Tax=Pectobacterium parmentieri TaxID=1905730 RepID=A0A8B3FDM7_PECPM|nr:hypothetical protein [Pectobacterium parmentieri]AOR61108.1 hypothetical protein A8F97_19760 [Pectobacterium parmentieri]AYH03413.1 hypothetical protein C5E26_22135 [Pectobacterium parmentieri]AYH07746.1 hypothetical protein C5E25_21615 [Pectobacterium parmentieri]AYH12224.1 hypothetical protein C5E24_22390 [Pectobacterium parmentieri]AYH16500.1 hypothetical protein C5E23_21230 [Pectobacterium parmentieri]